MAATTTSSLDIRRDFPILAREIDGKRLVYLDSAATSQKPESVIRALDDFNRFHNAPVHRSVYTLAEEATESYFPEFKAAAIAMIRAQGAIVGWTAHIDDILESIAHA